MYELVKKKNIWQRILIGIVAMFVITQLLKFFLKEPTFNINDDLIKTANEINKHCPIIIDSLIKLDNVNALKGNSLQYNYTIQMEKSQVDTVELIKINRQDIIDKMKKDSAARYFKQNNVTIKASYSDKNGVQFCTITVHPHEY